ncbi:MAG: flagellar assembly protein FliW [Desulfovibrionales bacterium]
MEDGQQTIHTRIGEIIIDPKRIVHFPRGLIGFEKYRDFVLLQVREESPFLLLQSTQDQELGLLLTDPYVFVQDYSIKIGAAEEKVLGTARKEDLAVLVTVSIPEGRPDRTTLNLTGPIVINSRLQVGIQVPQVTPNTPSHFVIKEQQAL